MKKIYLLLSYFITVSIGLIAQPTFLTLTRDNVGPGNGGTISKYDAATNTISAVHTFLTEGRYPLGNLCKVSNGKFYGMTTAGGTFGYGVIFSFDLDNSTYTVVHNFDNINGARPEGSLIQASDGKLYGMTSNGGGSFGGGVLFSFDPFTNTYTVLKTLDHNAYVPTGSLIQASDGKLYGMTANGGPGITGTIFSFDITNSAFTIIKTFANTDGANPRGTLIQALDGKLYGMTSEGGNTYKEEFYFDPITGIPTFIITPGDGVIFSFDITTSSYNVLYNFNAANGATPYGSLIQTSDGKLYGMASSTTTGFGVGFSFDLILLNYTVIKNFNVWTDGGTPRGSFIQGSDGKLYGTTFSGGNYGLGVVFSLDPLTGNYIKQDFMGANGARPFADLLEIEPIQLNCVASTTASAPEGSCSALVSNIDPIISPAGSSVTYTLTGVTTGNGNGTASGLQFNVGVTTVLYTSTDDPTKTCSFTVTVNPTSVFYQDADNDGYGNAAEEIYACTQPAGYVTDNTDCNDSNPTIHTPVTYYRDADNDGYGNILVTTIFCSVTPPAGYVGNSTDCDDSKATTHPGAAEICNNGIDDNCNNQVDEGCPVGIPSISLNDVSVYESSGVAILTVSLSNTSTSAITIGYSTLDGSASSKGKRGVIADYVAANGNIIVPAGSLSATIRITINTDNTVESPENFSVKLSLNKANAKKATISDGTGVVTILDGAGNRLPTTNKYITGLNQKLTIKAFPNPTVTYFTLVTQGNIDQPISLHVYDIAGRIIEKKYNMPPNSSISLGHSYKPGLYFIEIIQGNQKQTLKLLKGSQ